MAGAGTADVVEALAFGALVLIQRPQSFTLGTGLYCYSMEGGVRTRGWDAILVGIGGGGAGEYKLTRRESPHASAPVRARARGCSAGVAPSAGGAAGWDALFALDTSPLACLRGGARRTGSSHGVGGAVDGPFCQIASVRGPQDGSDTPQCWRGEAAKPWWQDC